MDEEVEEAVHDSSFGGIVVGVQCIPAQRLPSRDQRGQHDAPCEVAEAHGGNEAAVDAVQKKDGPKTRVIRLGRL